MILWKVDQPALAGLTDGRKRTRPWPMPRNLSGSATEGALPANRIRRVAALDDSTELESPDEHRSRLR